MSDRTLTLCPACVDKIGGACSGPDADWRPAEHGEPCFADDCDGSPKMLSPNAHALATLLNGLGRFDFRAGSARWRTAAAELERAGLARWDGSALVAIR